jgi:hemerythrin-like domain-containing protein
MSQPIEFRALVGGATATVEQPFDMLEACHQRVHRMLKLLARLRAHVGDKGVDAQAQQAARDVMRYFDLAAPQHHMDEELHVFPPLLAQGDPRIVAIVQRLQRDHLAMESNWARARTVLQLVADGAVQHLTPADEAALDTFGGLYDAHIEAEEQIAYPSARGLLDSGTLAQAGEEMARRRGVK